MKIRFFSLVILSVVTGIGIFFFTIHPVILSTLFTRIIMGVSCVLILQSLFTIYTMIYTWNNPDTYKDHVSPTTFLEPRYSFSALLAARNESRVIGDTIRSIQAINYPEELKELIIICRADDHATIKAAEKVITEIGNPRIKLVMQFEDLKNKPMSLNIGLEHATGDVVVIFDAEDEPHQDIYQAVNTTFIQKNADVVQSGVQLMDYRTSWYATLNVLEYYFWFKSALHFFAKVGAVPLGGNTVFMKRSLIQSIGGWNEHLLTEDADIGIRLSSIGANIAVIYDERHATQEETPPSYKGFIKQRTRWNQGFLQILFSGSWMRLPSLSQKILIAYLLSTPLFQALWLLYLPFSLILISIVKLPLLIALFSFIPLYLLMFQYILYTAGLYQFTRDYHLSFPLWMPLKLLVTLYPYQISLGTSSLNAAKRMMRKNMVWEKTEHTNAHRVPVGLAASKIVVSS